jgi:hypothetical protein
LRIGSIRSLISDVLACAPAHPSQQEDDLRKAVQLMAGLLKDGEWAEILSSDPDVAALEAEISRLIGAQQEDDARDAARYRWLRERMLGIDFDWADAGITALSFEMPDGMAYGGDCDRNIDAAMSDSAGEGGKNG